MDETARTREVARAYVERTEARDWAGLAELLAEDVVYVIPQTRERVRGRAAFLQFNAEYPGDWHLAIRKILADGHEAAALIDSRVGSEHQDACIWLDLNADGLVEQVTDYWPDPYEPPDGREHLVERYLHGADAADTAAPKTADAGA